MLIYLCFNPLLFKTVCGNTAAILKFNAWVSYEDKKLSNYSTRRSW